MTPQRNDKAVRDRFGEENAVKLLQTLRTLYDDFYSTEARFIADTPQDMEKLASQDFQKKHPGVAEQIVKALAWCYTFDYK